MPANRERPLENTLFNAEVAEDTEAHHPFSASLRALCGLCVEKPFTTVGETSLRIGCLEQKAQLPPRRRIWCTSALAWAQNVSTIPGIDGQ